MWRMRRIDLCKYFSLREANDTVEEYFCYKTLRNLFRFTRKTETSSKGGFTP